MSATTITITLPAELAPIVSAKAAADGKGLEEYTLSVLQRDAELPSLRDLFADVRAEIAASGTTDEELEREIDAAVAEVRACRRLNNKYVVVFDTKCFPASSDQPTRSSS